MITKDKLNLYSLKTLEEYVDRYKDKRYENKSVSVLYVIEEIEKRKLIQQIKETEK